MTSADSTHRALLDTLTRLQSALQDLAHLLEVHCLVIASGSLEAVQRTTRDIAAATEAVAALERRCGEHTDRLTGRIGSSLGELVDISDEPWRSVLDHHRRTLARTHAEVATRASGAADAARRAARRHRDTLHAALGESNSEFSMALAAPRRPLLVDRSA